MFALVLAPILYVAAVSLVRARFPALRGRRICLLIAHPDDEAMFFAPTVLALTRPEMGNHVKILCLSTGDADGLGETRRRELKKSGRMLGLKDEEDVFIIDDPEHFPDSMTKTWDEDSIANLLSDYFAPQQANPPPDSDSDSDSDSSDTRPQPGIDVLVTFDNQGVSSHPNHISLYHGARAFATLVARRGFKPVDVYTLTSVNIARKYISIGDLLTTLAAYVKDTGSGVLVGSSGGDDRPEALVFLNELFGSTGAARGTAWRAMTEAHQSQMRWFRYGWIVLSRYMVINDLKLETIDLEEEEEEAS